MNHARLTEQEIADAKGRSLVDLVAATVKLQKVGSDWWGLCPFHKEKSRSFKVDGSNQFYKCFGCGKGGDIISWVEEMESLQFAQAVNYLNNKSGLPVRHCGVYRQADPIKRREDNTNWRRASKIWENAKPIKGTQAHAYLKARGIRLPPSAELRFDPECEHKESKRFLPALVARLTDDMGFVSLQRTFLDPVHPRKADVTPNKKTLSAMRAAAVRLRAPTQRTLGLAEGIETALSAMQLYMVPVWATCGVQRLATIQIPKDIEQIIIFGDQGGVGEEQAWKALAFYEAKRIEVEIIFPRSDFGGAGGEDFNDTLQARVR